MKKRIISLFMTVLMLFSMIGIMPAGLIASAASLSASDAAINLIKKFEGCKLTAYHLSGETYWTIGYGHYGSDVHQGMTITQAQADAYLRQDVKTAEGQVNTFLNKNGISVNQNQFDALVSFTFNLGNVWVSEPTFQLKTYLIKGVKNYSASQITTAFTNWNKDSNLQPLEGLTRRRKAEAQLFLSGSNPILPGTVDSSYGKNRAYTATKRIYTYNEYGALEGNRYIDANDKCTIVEVYTSGFLKVTYPTSSGNRTAYGKTSDFNLNKAPTGYNISVSPSSVYDSETITVTITPYEDNITNYTLYYVLPDGTCKSYNMGTKKSVSMHYNGTGTVKFYAKVTNSTGSYTGSTTNGCVSVKVSRPNMGSKLDLGSDFYAYIVNNNSGNVLTNDGDNVTSKTKKSTSSQQWHFIKKSDGSYQIESVSGGKCLDANSGKGYSGDNVQVYKVSGETPQSWYIYSAGNNLYYLMPTCSNSAVLDVYDASTASGANVQIWAYNGTNAQKFRIEKINGASLSFSTKTVNLDLNGTNSATVKITAEGVLPSLFHFSCNRDTTAMSTSWGDWSGNTSPLTIKGKKTGTYTVEVSLVDANTSKTVYKDSFTVKITCSHSYGSWSTTKTATCNTTGEKKRTCSKCGNVEKQTIAKTDHKYTTTKVVAPTCTAQGYTLHTCSVCGTSYKDTYTNTKGHSYGSWTTKTAATCKTTGIETRTCNSCGNIEQRTVAKKAHTYTTKVVAPTTTAQGYTLHTCSMCGDSYKDNYTDKLQTVNPNAPQVVVDTKTVGAGGTVTIAVSLKNNPGISGLLMKLKYDSSVLTLQKAEAKNLSVTFSEKLTANPYSILWYDGLKNVTTNGAIAEFTFKVSDKAAKGSYPISIEFGEDDISDVNDNNVHFEKIPGYVNVSSHIAGDVNGDGKANVKDLIRLQQHLNGWNVTVVSGSTDINGDGKTNVKDLIRLQQFLNGWNVVVN